MRNLRIRRAHPADLDTLVRELGQRRFFADRFARQAGRRGTLLTAWRGNRPVGVLYLWLEDAEEDELREHLPKTPILNHLEIHPDHRGQGIGTRLITAAERRLRMLGCREVALAVEVTNGRAARLYKRLGYEDWPHPAVRCYSLTESNGERDVEICRILVKELLRGEADLHHPVGEVQ
ncbi:GNAT family N-acetyltransferase [Actinophytocola sp.]|uniref:GNAT family N-acetyltransferase n=1 Tax=Actinophytocola sp. TaxID=1872138 RepID=UPI003899F0A7